MYSVPDLILRVLSQTSINNKIVHSCWFHIIWVVLNKKTTTSSPYIFAYLAYYLPKATSSSSHVIAIKASAYPSSERGSRRPPSIELLSWALSWLSEHLAWPSQILCQWWIWNRNNLFCLDLFVIFIGKMNGEWILCGSYYLSTYE